MNVYVIHLFPGLLDTIRQRLLENTSTELQIIFNQTCALEMAQNTQNLIHHHLHL